jgi:hypothetical protein
MGSRCFEAWACAGKVTVYGKMVVLMFLCFDPRITLNPCIQYITFEPKYIRFTKYE